MTEDNDNDAEASIIHYFVDEAGDPVLFDGRGRVLAGTEGCSKYFIVGKLDVDDPDELGRKLEALRAELLADPYLKRIPSMQPDRGKTCAMFHAKDDVPEVRQAVFKLLAGEDLRFYAVVRDKDVLCHAEKQRRETDRKYRYNQNDQYDNLTSDLFRHFHGHADTTHICFAKRGKKDRNAALQVALERAKVEFQWSFGFTPGHFEVTCSTPREHGGLQAVDYYLWALQRYFERGESRYLEYVWPQVKQVHTLDEVAEGRIGVIYGPNRSLISPTDEKT